MTGKSIEKPKGKYPDLNMPVQYLKGVGPKMAQKLASLGIRTLDDLLHHYPREWEDRRQFCPLREAKANQEMTFRGKVQAIDFKETRSGLAIVSASIQDGTGQLICRWIRKKSYRYDVLQTFRKELTPGITLLVHGKIEQDFSDKIMMVDEHEVFNGPDTDSIHLNRIVPIYPLTEGLRQKFLRGLVYEVLFSTTAQDPLPKSIQQSQSILPLQAALKQIHFPDSIDEKEQARRRLAFQELFMAQLVLAIARKKRRVEKKRRYEIHKNLLTPFRQKCGFDFTSYQKKVINEIFSDLTSPFPMNRLLQGDVGSGKTVVAIAAMLLCCENKYQSVLMAPTEILAEQHFITLRHFLESLPVNVGLLTGSVTGKERKQFFEDCAGGKIDIAVGTHALLEKAVQFKKLGLVVIDEQHRFGVRHRLSLSQRSSLDQRGETPDVLVMTATPIPRTLTLGLYGDLDCSVIEGLPPGRQKIETLLKNEAEAYHLIRREIQKGRQAYIVYPLVDESNKIELKSAINGFNKLRKEIFGGFKVGLLHGQLPGNEKEKTMEEFHQGKYSILVATTVIEVGIDVPNATVMVIQNAERFGLSTLHQLRGRIGRGKDSSFCVLVADPKTEDSQQRIEVLLRSQNGFEIAEKDLQLRGPGEIFGTSQHGMPPFKIADFSRDIQLIQQSQKSAREWLENDPAFQRPESLRLKDHLRKHFSKNWHWANIA